MSLPFVVLFFNFLITTCHHHGGVITVPTIMINAIGNVFTNKSGCGCYTTKGSVLWRQITPTLYISLCVCLSSYKESVVGFCCCVLRLGGLTYYLQRILYFLFGETLMTKSLTHFACSSVWLHLQGTRCPDGCITYCLYTFLFHRQKNPGSLPTLPEYLES